MGNAMVTIPIWFYCVMYLVDQLTRPKMANFTPQRARGGTRLTISMRWDRSNNPKSGLKRVPPCVLWGAIWAIIGRFGSKETPKSATFSGHPPKIVCNYIMQYVVISISQI